MPKVLSHRELQVVLALAETLFPPEGGLAVDARSAHVAEYVDAYLAAAPPPERLQLRAMFLLFELAHAALGPARPHRFSRAPADSQRAYLERWCNSDFYPRRASFQALRSLLTIAWTADPEVERRMGWPDGVEAVAAWNARNARPSPSAEDNP